MSGKRRRESKQERRVHRDQKRREKLVEQVPSGHMSHQTRPKRLKPVEARTEAQGHYLIAMDSFDLTFGVGPAGTGKTYVCGARAAEALEGGEASKIVITRPAREAGEELGFLPGDESEKYAPYIQPFRDVLEERMGKSKVEYLLKTGVIEAAPLAYMRGRSFKDAWVILDEAQNTTPEQMKMFLTRIGDNSKVIVNGDPRQKDVRGESGLQDAIHRVGHLSRVRVVEFGREDVVRSGLVQDIVEAYEGF